MRYATIPLTRENIDQLPSLLNEGYFRFDADSEGFFYYFSYVEEHQNDSDFFAYLKGRLYLDERYHEDNERYFASMKALAEKGYVPSYSDMAGCYLYGKGVEKDPEKAYEWVIKGVEQGCPVCICYLGLFYVRGLVVEENLQKAEELYLQSAKSGYAVAYYRLSNLYYQQGLYEKSYYYNDLAAQGHVKIALTDKGLMLYNGTGVAKSQDEGLYYLYKSYKQGDAKAKDRLDAWLYGNNADYEETYWYSIDENLPR